MHVRKLEGKSVVSAIPTDSLYRKYDFLQDDVSVLLISAEVIKHVENKDANELKTEACWREQVTNLQRFLKEAEDHLEITSNADSDWNFIVCNDGRIVLGHLMANIWDQKEEYLEFIDKVLNGSSLEKLIIDLGE
jgi:hypothetical protein